MYALIAICQFMLQSLDQSLEIPEILLQYFKYISCNRKPWRVWPGRKRLCFKPPAMPVVTRATIKTRPGCCYFAFCGKPKPPTMGVVVDRFASRPRSHPDREIPQPLVGNFTPVGELKGVGTVCCFLLNRQSLLNDARIGNR